MAKAFQSKLTLDQLRTEIITNKKSIAEVKEEFNLTEYTLKQKLFDAAVNDPKNAKLYCIAVPLDVSTITERKKGINISSALCDMLEIEVGSKFEVNKEGKKIVLTPKK